MTKDDPYQLQQLSPDQRMHLLMINAGSLSLRYQVIDTALDQAWLSGDCRRSGDRAGETSYSI